jgi:hypothetical protein
MGVEVYPGFAGKEVLYDWHGAVVGVATGGDRPNPAIKCKGVWMSTLPPPPQNPAPYPDEVLYYWHGAVVGVATDVLYLHVNLQRVREEARPGVCLRPTAIRGP